MTRFRLKGNLTFCLTLKSGWIRIYNTILRWNTVSDAGLVLISLTRIKRIEYSVMK